MICVPIISKTNSTIFKDIEKANEVADMIELRADYFLKLELKPIIDACKKPVIFTIRTKEDQGKFEGKEEERLKYFKEAIHAGVKYIDLEHNSKLIKKIAHKHPIIVSYHNFKETNKAQIEKIYNKIKEKPIIKIVTKANKIEDNITIYNLLKTARKDNQNIIAFCMGEYGESSRILCKKFGSFLTFASLELSKESAPGQLPINKVLDIYNYKNINEETKIYGLVGNPVNKSKGYIIHNHFFQKEEINAVYLNFLTDDFKSFYESHKPLFSGLSITMPHKQAASSMFKKDIPINTISSGRAYNTDGLGAIVALEKQTKIADKKILIIGAGGVSQGIIKELLKHTKNISISNRTVKTGKEVASRFNIGYIDPKDIDETEPEIIINCTPIGMSPKLSDSPIKNSSFLEEKIVMDTIYNPEETKLLKDAKKQNSKTISGQEMFIYQALEQQKLWTEKCLGYKDAKNILKNENDTI